MRSAHSSILPDQPAWSHLRRLPSVEPGDVLQEAFSEIYEHLADWQRKSDLGFFLWVRLQTGQKLNQVHRRHIDVEARDARLEVPLMLQTVPGASSFAIASALLDAPNTPSGVAMKNEAGIDFTWRSRG